MSTQANKTRQLWLPLLIIIGMVLVISWIIVSDENLNNLRGNDQAFANQNQGGSTQTPTNSPVPSATGTKTAFFAILIEDSTSTPSPVMTEVIPTFTSEPAETLNCTYTIHYWRVYTDAWGINSFDFDSRSYSKEQAIAILDLEDPSLITTRLLQQYFIALLNTTNGADPSGIDRTLEQVNEWLIQHPPEAGLTQVESLEGETFTGALMDYNDGVTGPGRCLDEPLTPTPGATPTPFNYTPPTPPTPSPTATNPPAPLGTIILPTATPTQNKKPGGGGSKPKPTNPPATSEPTNPPPPPDTPEPPPPTDPPQPTQIPPTPAPTQPPPDTPEPPPAP
jgi:hypothetical protein